MPKSTEYKPLKYDTKHLEKAFQLQKTQKRFSTACNYNNKGQSCTEPVTD